MKSLFISFNAGEYCTRLASAISQEADICLMLPTDVAKPYGKWIDPKVDFRPFNKPRLREPIRQLGTMRQIIRTIEAYNPDVIHMQYAHLWFSIALPFLSKFPLVTSVHDPRDHLGDKSSKKTPQFIKDFGYRRSTRIIAHSSQMKPLIHQALDFPSGQIDVVPLIEFGDVSHKTDIQEEPNTILFFGRIWGYKGLQYLIEAEPLIRKEIPDIKIVIGGEGDDFDQYRAMMEVPEHFEVHNEYISSDDKKAALFRRACVVVLPYVEATQSAVIPLAYNFEKPVIATTVGGLPDQVEEGITGYLVAPRNAQAIADKVIYLLNNEQQRKTMGQNGKEFMNREWSSSKVAKETVAVYKKAVEDAA